MPANDATVTTPTPSIEADSVSEQRLSDDKVFHLLQNRRRRNVIRYLSDAEGTVSMRDIAEQVAAWEHDTSVAALDSDERQRVYIPLYQNHLPKLDEEGVIEYDQSRGTVKRTDVADQLEQYLSREYDESTELPPSEPATEERNEDEEEWADAYLGATGVASAFFMLAVFNVPVVSGVSHLLLASLMLVTFATVTFAHTAFGSTADVPVPF
jgi:hypothetical protein